MMSLPIAPGSDGVAVSRTALIIGTLATITGTFIFRFLSVEYTNDHFVHLSRGAQILYGEVPIRDFFDPGLTLQYYASAAALLLSGHNLFGETILTIAFIAVGAALTFVAAARLSGSIWLAASATAAAVMANPRLYSYPKAFFYSAAILVAWRYALHQGTGNFILLTGVPVIAFFFRHDHGVYTGFANLVLLTILHWPQPRQMVITVAKYGALSLLLLLPFFIFVQRTEGLLDYAASGDSPGFRIVWQPVTVDLKAPLLTLAPPSGPRVNVRWADGVDPDARERLERRHALVSAEHVDGSTWSYVPLYLDRDHIGSLVDDPAVADTHGINRPGRALEVEPPWYIRLQRQVPLLRIRLLPGLFSRGNADAWFYYVTFLLPFIGFALLVLLSWRGAIGRPEAAVAGMACVLCVIIVQTLVRGSPDSRLPDVASPIGVVGAWVCARFLGIASGGGSVARRSGVALVAASVMVTLWSVGTFAQVSRSVQISQVLLGPAAVWHRANEVAERLRMRPIDAWTRESTGLGAIKRYVFECTADTDRLVAAWFAPEVYFHVERAFAGGQVYWVQRWHNSPDDQRLTIDRLERERVPIVIEKDDWEYYHYFPVVADYLHRRYREFPLPEGAASGFRVLIDPRLAPTGTYEPLGAPCYR